MDNIWKIPKLVYCVLSFMPLHLTELPMPGECAAVWQTLRMQPGVWGPHTFPAPFLNFAVSFEQSDPSKNVSCIWNLSQWGSVRGLFTCSIMLENR